MGVVNSGANDFLERPLFATEVLHLSRQGLAAADRARPTALRLLSTIDPRSRGLSSALIASAVELANFSEGELRLLIPHPFKGTQAVRGGQAVAIICPVGPTTVAKMGLWSETDEPSQEGS